MIDVSTLTETVYVFKLTPEGLDAAIADPGQLVAALVAVRGSGHTSKPNGSVGHLPAEKPARHVKRVARKKSGGVKRESAKKKGRLNCPHCERTFGWKKNLALHIKFEHPTKSDVKEG